MRDRGIINTSLQAMYYNFKLLADYVMQKKLVDISKPFPIWIKHLVKYRVDQIDERKLKKGFNLSRKTLKSRIETGFKDDKATKTTVMKEGGISRETITAIDYLLSHMEIKYVFKQNEIIDEIIKVLKLNKIEFNEHNFRKQSDKITLCILLLLHNSVFEIQDYQNGICRISAEQSMIPFNYDFRFPAEEQIPSNKAFGNLNIHGYLIVKVDGSDMTFAYPIISTNLSVADWCDNVCTPNERQPHGAPTNYRKIFMNHHEMSLSADFKLQIEWNK